MPPVRADVAAVLDQLFADRPALHGHEAVEPVNWQLGDRLLRWLLEELPAGASTLETGCGYSTIAFAASSGAHWVISPIAAEHERVKGWCEAHGIDTSHVRFVAEGSQRWLPGAESAGLIEPLDAVLVDGDHAYPIPGIDWYYTAGALKVGGLMVIDDVSIRACGDLRRFLEHEAGRWEAVATIDDATVFRKLSADVVAYTPWTHQPWNRQQMSAGRLITAARSKVRLRTRLRARHEQHG